MDPVQTNSESPDTDATCANCGAKLRASYCGVCGQRAGHRIVPLWQVTNEFLEDLVDLDLRVLRTLPTFFLRPGQLTTEYVRGRRRRYIRPLRLYLFSSFLLFTVLALMGLDGIRVSFGPSTSGTSARLEEARAELTALRATLTNIEQPGHAQQGTAPDSGEAVGDEKPGREAVATIDEAISALAFPVRSDFANKSADEMASEMVGPSVGPSVEGTVGRVPHVPKGLIDDMVDRAPYLMFLLVPTFALLLKLLYIRRGRLYLEHLIFALHVHALAFIVFAISAGVGALEIGTSFHLDQWMAAVPFGYLWVAMRHVYGQSWRMTAAKMTRVLVAYGIILVGAVVLLAVLTVAFT